MTKYIDADRLRAEIEKRIENYNASIEKNYSKEKTIKGERDSWKWAECKWFLNLITSLQQEQPEVDLEKEIEEYWSTMGWNKVMELRKFKPIARYFYGLGQLNSK